MNSGIERRSNVHFNELWKSTDSLSFIDSRKKCIAAFHKFRTGRSITKVLYQIQFVYFIVDSPLSTKLTYMTVRTYKFCSCLIMKIIMIIFVSFANIYYKYAEICKQFKNLQRNRTHQSIVQNKIWQKQQQNHCVYHILFDN